jgi:hypothetical protein
MGLYQESLGLMGAVFGPFYSTSTLGMRTVDDRCAIAGYSKRDPSFTHSELRYRA